MSTMYPGIDLSMYPELAARLQASFQPPAQSIEQALAGNTWEQALNARGRPDTQENRNWFTQQLAPPAIQPPAPTPQLLQELSTLFSQGQQPAQTSSAPLGNSMMTPELASRLFNQMAGLNLTIPTTGTGGVGGGGDAPPTPPSKGGVAPAPGTTPGAGGDLAWMDLPQFGGPFSAPLISSQMDAMQGFNQLFSQQPKMGSQQILDAINLSLSGGPVFGPNAGQPLSQQLAGYEQPSLAKTTASLGAKTGFENAGPAATNTNDLNAQITQMFGGPNTQTNRTTSSSFLGGLYNPTQTDPTQAALGGGTWETALSRSGRPDTMENRAWFSEQARNAVPSLINSDLTGMGKTAIGTALQAPRFDTTDMFNTGEQVFRNDLDKTLAMIREQYSGYGMGPGSSDREQRLLEEAGNQSARFRLGQLDLGRQSFEDAEQRRISALGQLPNVSQTANQNVANQLQGLPALLAAESAPGQESLQKYQAQTQALPAFLDVMQTPFQEGLASAATLAEPASNRQLQSASLLGSLEQVPFQNYMQFGTQQSQNLLNTLPGLFGAENLPYQRYGQQYALGEGARSVADQDLIRQMSEYARTQGGGLNQLMSILSGTPLQSVGFGPSDMSQWAQLAQGAGTLIASLFGGGGGLPGGTQSGGGTGGYGIGG